MHKPITYDTAYPGSMIERKRGDGGYIDRNDISSLLAALHEHITERQRRIEDLEHSAKQADQYIGELEDKVQELRTRVFELDGPPGE